MRFCMLKRFDKEYIQTDLLSFAYSKYGDPWTVRKSERGQAKCNNRNHIKYQTLCRWCLMYRKEQTISGGFREKYRLNLCTSLRWILSCTGIRWVPLLLTALREPTFLLFLFHCDSSVIYHKIDQNWYDKHGQHLKGFPQSNILLPLVLCLVSV